jgi:hypothetical protein
LKKIEMIISLIIINIKQLIITIYYMSNTTEQTVASFIMTSGGSTFGILGTILSSVSSLYIIRNISNTGCSAVEYLPKLLDVSGPGEKKDESSETATQAVVPKTTFGRVDAFLKRFGVNVKAYMWMGVFLVAGVGSKKLGGLIASPSSIAFVEKLLYRKE